MERKIDVLHQYGNNGKWEAT